MPVRVGVCGKDVIFSLSDLLNALSSTANVTHLTKRLPEETYFKGSYVDLVDGLPTNGHTYVVTYEGAQLSLPRIHGVDLYDIMMLLRWMKTVKADKIKKGA
jgi:hypothetical protein